MKKITIGFLVFIIAVILTSTTSTAHRFKNNGNGTITDTKTGLMWQENGSASGLLNWDAAVKYCKNLQLAGYTDWRLPLKEELKKLINERKNNQHKWLNSQGFKNVLYSFYWSSSLCADYVDDVWGVNMIYGSFFNYRKMDVGSVLSVRSAK